MRYVLAVAVLIAGVAVGEELPSDTNQIKTLTVEQAKALAQRKGDLSLDGLATLSDEVAEVLAHHHGLLSLDGLTTLSAKAARALGQHNGALVLGHLTTLSDEAAKGLEAVSKLSKGDHQTGDLQEGQEHLGLTLVSDDEPAEVSEPGHGPFDGPAAAVAA